jgi:superfamily II DNA or RNA helicase
MIEIIISNEIVINSPPMEIIPDILEKFSIPNPKWKFNNKHGYSNNEVTQSYLCAEHDDEEDILYVTRGCFNRLANFLETRRLKFKVIDSTDKVKQCNFKFHGKLKPYQKKAVKAFRKCEDGVLHAATGSGKTVISLAIIAERNCPTLIVVHTTELVKQWIERINQFLNIPVSEIGIIGGGKKIIKNVTVATIQTLYKVNRDVCEYFGHLIIDECHKIPSRTFQEGIFPFNSKYFLGLTATPYRRDGLEQLIFSTIGEIVHTVDKGALKANKDILIPRIHMRNTEFEIKPVKRGRVVSLPTIDSDYGIIMKQISEDHERTKLICEDVINNLHTGMCLIISDRKHHCAKFHEMLTKNDVYSEMLLGHMSDVAREKVTAKVQANEVPVLIATASLIGEGFDCKYLTNLFLTMPIKFKGRLTQYVGRILRPDGNKDKIPQIFDYVDKNISYFNSTAAQRLKVYGNEFPLAEFHKQHKKQ